MKRCDEVEGKVLPQDNSTVRKVLGLNWDVNFDKVEFEFSEIVNQFNLLEKAK